MQRPTKVYPGANICHGNSAERPSGMIIPGIGEIIEESHLATQRTEYQELDEIGIRSMFAPL